VAYPEEGTNLRDPVNKCSGPAAACSQCGKVADPRALLEYEDPDGTVAAYCLECALINLCYGRFGLT
jgi:hypothetical protein